MASQILECDQDGTLVARTIKLLNQRNAEHTLFELSVTTGVPFYWLRKFKCHEIRQPSVNRVQHLYETLSGTKLNLG